MKKIATYFAVLVIGSCLVLVIFFFGLIFLVSIAGPYSAWKLTPPVYPNSQFIERDSGGGNLFSWKRWTYRTTDTPDQVVFFMEQYMPGFEQDDYIHPINGQLVYSNAICDETTWLAREFGTNEGHPPCAGVQIFIPSDNSSETLIEIGTSWATP
jgi:hypothetical protein